MVAAFLMTDYAVADALHALRASNYAQGIL